jgi:glycosyltransferase involved in cell wall biosynthesis
MKILHVFKEYHPVVGGIQNHIRVLSSELAKDKNFEVEVLVTNIKSKSVIEYIDGVKVIKAGRIAQVTSTPLSTSLVKFIRKAKPDILHLHFPYPLGELASLFLTRCDKMVLTYHSDIVKQKKWLYLYAPLLKQLLRKVRVIISSNPNYVRGSNLLSKYRNKIEIIPYGIDIGRFEKPNETKVKEIKDRYGSAIVLFVGRLCYYKGIEYLIEASKNVNAKFLLIGDGPFKSKLEDYVKRNNLKGKIVLLGKVGEDELRCYYHAADILVLPSSHRSEAFGIVLLEGMACGLPLITTELGTGTSFVNIHNQTGLVVPPCDSGALQEALNYVLNNKELRYKFAQNARERVRCEFTKEKMVESMKNLYHHVLNT